MVHSLPTTFFCSSSSQVSIWLVSSHYLAHGPVNPSLSLREDTWRQPGNDPLDLLTNCEILLPLHALWLLLWTCSSRLLSFSFCVVPSLFLTRGLDVISSHSAQNNAFWVISWFSLLLNPHIPWEISFIFMTVTFCWKTFLLSSSPAHLITCSMAQKSPNENTFSTELPNYFPSNVCFSDESSQYQLSH